MSIEAYFDAGMVLGLFVGCLTFIAAYVYCANAYGITTGLGLGWLPSGILAVAVGWFAMVVWPVPVVLTGIMFFLYSGRDGAQRWRKADRDGQKRRTPMTRRIDILKIIIVAAAIGILFYYLAHYGSLPPSPPPS